MFHEYYTYDEYGNMVEFWTVTENGERINYTTYRYDEKGNLLERNNPGQSSKVMTYDDGGRILTERHYFGDECKAEIEYTYDEAGYLIRKYEVECDQDEQIAVTDYTYNEDHTHVRIEAFWGGALSNYTEQTLRDNGDVIESATYAADGSWLNSASCEYDAQGRRISQWNRFERDEQADFQTIFTYDERGLLISRNADYYYGNLLEYTYEPFEILVRVD